MAIKYLRKLSVNRLVDNDVRDYMIKFRESKGVQKFAALSLNQISGDKYADQPYSIFIAFFKESKEVQKIVLKYLKKTQYTESKRQYLIIK